MREKGINSINRQGRMKKKNKTLGTERSENIDTLYIDKIIFNHSLLTVMIKFNPATWVNDNVIVYFSRGPGSIPGIFLQWRIIPRYIRTGCY